MTKSQSFIIITLILIILIFISYIASAKETKMSASVEKSRYYTCLDICEQEYLKNANISK